MAFRIDTNMGLPDSGSYRGEIKEAACSCWFTSKGSATPRMLKYVDEEGIIRTLQNITVLQEEQKYYNGISTREYRCETEIEGICYPFVLLFRPENCTWSVSFGK
ncbi:MAG: hypothetical protein ACOYBL_07665 [Lachnospiraceae bacterium]|jgi:hypothetical protein